jgi:hypothetical protein
LKKVSDFAEALKQELTKDMKKYKWCILWTTAINRFT